MIGFTYSHTHCYLLRSNDREKLLAFDAGWPCSLLEYARGVKAAGYRFDCIRWAIISHFHLDHAGLVRDFQDAGIQCLLFENQGDGIDGMERLIARSHKDYRPIFRDRFLPLRTDESRAFLSSIGIAGEVIRTPGHSDDSVSLVTDAHEALIGDLYPLSQVMDDDEASLGSWAAIRALGARHIFPSHAEPFELA